MVSFRAIAKRLLPGDADWPYSWEICPQSHLLGGASPPHPLGKYRGKVRTVFSMFSPKNHKNNSYFWCDHQ